MSVRGWAVGMVSTAAVVTGVVAVQSGIPGTTALPILPHRSAAPAPGSDGAELPAPVEVGAAPPSAGAVQEPPVARAAVAPQRLAAPAADRSEKRSRHSGEDAGKDATDAGKDGTDAGKNGTDAGTGSKGSAGKDSGGKSDGGRSGG